MTAKNYVCTFCEETFKSKAYWRTHEEELHEQPRRWTCPDCYRTFHAEKKYRHHHAGSHGCANCILSKHEERMQNPKSRSCAERRVLRVHNKQAYGCGFCAHLLGSWGERCDHIAGHYERGAAKRDWDFSNVVRGLLIQPKMAEAWMALLRAEHGDDREAWPKFAWDKKDARDLHRALEQNGAVRDRVAALAQSAYDLGRPMDHVALVTEPKSDIPSRALHQTESVKAEPYRRIPATVIQPIQHRASETLVVPVSSQPLSIPHTETPVPQVDQPMTDMDFLHNALNEQLDSGPFIAPDFDFHPDWSLAQGESNILTFDYPGAYTEFEARRL
ncbi:hypothetical protein K490DRAFT_53214 [Saccharata proteae CBS 121410]|uniref:C2H2-type domain-containing protein n=1 Tax=Saccharata proteae CBS 121410 TaxID=1314787 RepID=A0A9P4I405_9PEZI|nr:hypothetical protein K490DRAFT_53214 [Saccharata proteae CBS 121410]